MSRGDKYILYILGVLFIVALDANCPSDMSINFLDFCYGLKYDLIRMSDAETNCKQLADGATIGVITDSKVLPLLLADVRPFIAKKTTKAYFWVGMRAEPPPKPGEQRETDKRRWIFDIDDSKVIEEEYELWAETPSDKLSCAVINGTQQFQTVAVDCGGGRLPVICQKFDNPCHDDNKPYFVYEDMCLAVISGALEYNKIHGVCSDEGKPAPIKDEHQKLMLVNAVENSFIGGAIFTGLAKQLDGSWEFHDGTIPADGDWASGQPDKKFDCAGISLQFDGTLKYRTTNCDGVASSLCSYKMKLDLLGGGGETTTETATTTESTTPITTTEGFFVFQSQ